jgi:molecular chaperone DnaK (HSP70)
MELSKASGSGCGGRSVDNAFFKLLDTMFGQGLMERLKAKKTKSYLTLYRDFEKAKRTITPDNEAPIQIQFPCRSFSECMDSPEKFENFIQKKEIKMVDGKLVLDAKTMKKLFQKTIDNILTNIESALKFNQSEEVSMIMLVGGFAKSQLLQKAIKAKFKGKRMIIPEDAGLAVLKGAVLYGHNPETIDPRVTRYTYGVEMSTPFITGLHEPTRSYVDEFGKRYCHGTFARIIQQNTVVKLGTIVKRTYSIPPYTTESNIQFYTSEKDDPLYTDDRSCRKMGTLVISIPIPSEEQREVEVEYIFGNTEINVRAKETKYQKEALSFFIFE